MKGPLLIVQPVGNAEFALHTNWSLQVQTVAAVVTPPRNQFTKGSKFRRR